MFVTNHPASQAKVKERAERVLTGLEGRLPTEELAEVRQRSRESELDSLANQLALDL